MPLVLMLVFLLGAGVPVEASAGQQRSVPRLGLPVLSADVSKQCCRVCRKGKPCGDGCISATKQCKKGEGCACALRAGPELHFDTLEVDDRQKQLRPRRPRGSLTASDSLSIHTDPARAAP